MTYNRVNDKNRLSIINSELSKEWHFKNLLKPNDVTCCSSKKVWWICEKGHEWLDSVNNRHRKKYKCPYCSGNRASLDNNLTITHPELCKEWHFLNDIKPTEVTYGSSKTVWWVCNKGHEWKTSVGLRTNQKNKCPYCQRKKASKDNNLTITHPELSKEWHPSLNGDLKPENSLEGSHKKVWWKCEKGHEWFTIIKDRALKNSKCPYCCNQKISIENSLSVTHPELSKEWHPKNNITPNKVSYGTTKKFWWVCEKGHEYESRVDHRALSNSGCPYCLYKSQEECRKIFENIFNKKFIKFRPKWLVNIKLPLELDGYNEELKLAFEYDGEYHYIVSKYMHNTLEKLENTKKRDKVKDILCLKNNISLIRIPYTEKNNLQKYIKKQLINLGLF